MAVGSISILSLISFRKLKSLLLEKQIIGSISGATFSRGHLIKDPQFEGEIVNEEVSTVIIGAGVSGLSAGYHLQKSGHLDFKIIDLEDRVGGNSSGGSTTAGKYPLGAHYVPLASSESVELKEFFQEVGIITNKDIDSPEYNPYYICSMPQERLFLHGRWQEGLEPNQGVSEFEKNEFLRFFELMESLKEKKGRDGLRAFTIPLSRSSQDSEFLKYDQMTMKEFLQENDFLGEHINWYVNYCCLDDYGAPLEKVSAWAGIHYFASRNGVGKNLTSSDVITWPEGNSWLTNKMAGFLKEKFQLGSVVYEVVDQEDSYIVKSFDFNKKVRVFTKCRKVVYASPLFTAKKVIKVPSLLEALKNTEIDSSPWMTANIQIDDFIEDDIIPLSWDNVNYHGKSLGYIYANQQDLDQVKKSINLTQYWPLFKTTSKLARIKALSKTHQEWCEDVIHELELTHEGIREKVKRIDISLWGHAMAIPKVNFLQRIQDTPVHNDIIFAHTDHAGISIFEEAFYQGLSAAIKVQKG